MRENRPTAPDAVTAQENCNQDSIVNSVRDTVRALDTI